MDPSLAPTVQILEMNTRLFEKALGDLHRDDLVRSVVPHSNSLLWIGGHLTWARYMMAGMLGPKLDFPLPPIFGRGAAPDADAALPEPEVVFGAWRDVSAVLPGRLREATTAQLGAPSGRALPIADGTVLGVISFLTFHEGYHIGQLALLRKALGRPGLVDA